MKKVRISSAIAVMAAFAGLTACSGKDKTQVDSDTVAVEIPTQQTPSKADPAVLATYNGAYFTDEANKKGATDSIGYVETPSGLRYVMLEEGSGVMPNESSVVLVDYEGVLADGTKFDSSFDRGESISFPLQGVIPGWTEGLQLMKEGGTAVFYIPAELAYGEKGVPDAGIQPNAPLVFLVQLHKIVAPQMQ